MQRKNGSVLFAKFIKKYLKNGLGFKEQIYYIYTMQMFKNYFDNKKWEKIVLFSKYTRTERGALALIHTLNHTHSAFANVYAW